MADYERLVCMTCKSVWTLGCKRSGKTTKILIRHAAKFEVIQRMISEINQGAYEYEGISDLQLAAYCEQGNGVPSQWLAEHAEHDLRDFGDLTWQERDETLNWNGE